MASTRTDEDEVRPGIRDFLGEHLALLKAHRSFSGYERNCVWLNRRDGTFADISGVSGADSIGDGRGCVFVDFDDDGDLDVFVRAMHGPAHLLFRNERGAANGFVRVELVGRSRGRDAFGAVVRLKTSAGILTRLRSGGAGFVSQNDPRLHFGLGGDERAEWLEIVWPDGRRELFPGPPAGETVRLVEPEPGRGR